MPQVFINSKKSEAPDFDKVAVIDADGESQKPDADLVIWRIENDKPVKYIILSLKTSLRERAGQTYRWKLLMEIAGAKDGNEIKSKYNITYEPPLTPLVCFATVNFYNEIGNPQSKGMLKFFDKAFIGKEIVADFISNLSELPEFVNQ